MNIAIFGATSIIAKEYIQVALEKSSHNFSLFSRNIGGVNAWLDSLECDRDRLHVFSYNQFCASTTFDVIINFIGRGDPKLLKHEEFNFLVTNDFFDNIILNYLLVNQSSKYIYISSGASYLSSFDSPLNEKDSVTVDLNSLRSFDIYSVSKQLSEFKHRKLANLNIVDLRIFSYVRGLDLVSEGSLLGSIFSSIKNGKEFVTSNVEIYRDYINSQLFYEAVDCVLDAENMNCGLDLYSKQPTSKFEILNMLAIEFGLRYRINNNLDVESVNITGLKKNYYSNNRAIAKFGYLPSVSSIDMIRSEANSIFNSAA